MSALYSPYIDGENVNNALSFTVSNQLESLNAMQNVSLMSMYGLPEDSSISSPLKSCDGKRLTTLPCIVEEINKVFSPIAALTWTERKAAMFDLLRRVDLTTTDLSKYIFYDKVIPYTRNLMATDNVNYTLLLLCWSPGKESKIHDHPCQGCFVRTVEGSIKEWTYSTNKDSNEISATGENVYNAGLVSFMSDDIGLHKIGNPHPTEGALSLHLYVPPFQKCKIWSGTGKVLNEFQEGRIGYYSEYGIRTPNPAEDNLMYYI